MNGFKAAWIAAITAMSVYFQEIMIPVCVLCCVMLADYVTGIVKAGIVGELNSRTGAVGIAKKIGMLCLVGVGCVIDYLVTASAGQIGLEWQLNMAFAMLATAWLIVNECISITENLNEIGVPVPGFMQKALRQAKDKIYEEDEKK